MRRTLAILTLAAIVLGVLALLYRRWLDDTLGSTSAAAFLADGGTALPFAAPAGHDVYLGTAGDIRLERLPDGTARWVPTWVPTT